MLLSTQMYTYYRPLTRDRISFHDILACNHFPRQPSLGKGGIERKQMRQMAGLATAKASARTKQEIRFLNDYECL